MTKKSLIIFILLSLLFALVGLFFVYNGLCPTNQIRINSFFSLSSNFNWGLIIAIIGIFATGIYNHKKIAGWLYRRMKINPLEIQVSKILFPKGAMIKNPKDHSYFDNYVRNNLVFHNHDKLLISITNNVDRTLRLSPVVKVSVLSIIEIVDYPVKLLPHRQQPYGMAGGGDISDYFKVSLTTDQREYNAIFQAVPNQKDPDSILLTETELEVFQLDVECQKGYYFNYKIGIEYSKGQYSHIQWYDKVFSCGNPEATREWYFYEEQLGNNKYLIVRSDAFEINNRPHSKG